MTALSVVIRWLLCMAAFAVLGLSYFVVLPQALSDLPQTTEGSWIEVTPDGNSPVFLGRAALIQPAQGSVAERHMGLVREGDAIIGYDVAAERVIGIYDKDDTYTQTGELPIPQGTSVLLIGDVAYRADLQGDRLELRPEAGDGRVITLTRTSAVYDAPALFHEQTTSLEERVGQWMGRYSVGYSIGGEVASARIRGALARRTLPDSLLPASAARLVYSQDGSVLGGSWTLARGVSPAAILQNRIRTDVEARPITIVDEVGVLQVSKLILGRTTYELSYTKDFGVVRLTPILRAGRIDPDALEPLSDPRIQRMVRPPEPALSFEGLFAASGVVGAAALLALLVVRLLAPVGLAPVAVSAVALWFALVGQGSTWLTLVPAFCVGLAATGAFLLLFGKPSTRWISPGLAGVILITSGCTGFVLTPPLLAPVMGPSVDALAFPVAACWIALAAPLISRGIVPAAVLFWLLFIVVALFGAVSGLRLSLLEPTNAYERLMDRHLIALCGVGLVASGILCLSEAGGWGLGRRLLLPTGTGPVASFVLVLLGLAYAFFTAIGSETGFMGLFQPSEMAKALLCVVVAFTLSRDIARRAMLSARDGGMSLTSPIIALFMIAAILVASLLNYDMSPIIVSFASILLGLTAGAVLHFNQLRTSTGDRRRSGLPVPRRSKQVSQLSGDQVGAAFRRWVLVNSSRWPLLLLGCVLGLLLLLSTSLAALDIFGENKAFVGLSDLLRDTLMTPWLRVQSWWDMQLVGAEGIIDFPQTGQQLRMGREAILEAHCMRSGVLCPAGVGDVRTALANERLLAVPAVQDDFAGIALMHSFGIDGAILYGGAQFALIGVSLALGFQALTTRGTFRIGAWLTGISVIGLTGVVAAQIILAWGNVLGLLPIMGQPMTFVSFGASHHIGVALPFAAATLIAAQTVSFRAPTDVLSGLNLYRRRKAT